MWWVLSTVAETVKNRPTMRETQVQSLGQEDPLWQPTPVFLPGKFHGQRSLAGYSPRGHKELDTTEPLTLCTAEVVSKPGGGPGRETGIYMYIRPSTHGAPGRGETGNPED